MKIIITIIVLFSMQLVAQPWQYDFGTGTGSFNTANSTDTEFLPNPSAGGGFDQVVVGIGGGFVLDNPGTSLGEGSELQITSPSFNGDGAINKFSISDYDASQLFSVGFSAQFQGGINPNYGIFYFFIGDGAYFGDDNYYTPPNIFTGLRFVYSDAEVYVTLLQNGSTWGVPYATLDKNTTYNIELFGNNSATDETYTHNGGPYTLEANSTHLFINGSLIRIESKGIGLLTDESNIDSYMFLGGASTNNSAAIYLDDISYSNQLEDGPPELSGAIAGTVNVNGTGLGGVEVELTDADGFVIPGIDAILTNGDGSYAFPELDPADYQVGIVVPLGYGLDPLDVNPALVTVIPDETTIADFHLQEVSLSNTARGRYYWKKQFALHIYGYGWLAQETEAELITYIERVHQYYTPHFNIFQDLTTFRDWKDVLRFRWRPSKRLERAKAQVAALILNFTSMKISQNEIVTYDNRTAGDVLTYCSVLINDPNATNHELRLAKRLARKVNWHQMIGAGKVPDGGVLYKGLMENIDWSFGSPTDYTLSQNYPNPFNPSTTIQYQIPQSGNVTIKVYDVLGNQVASLVDEMKQQGNYQVSFDASALSSGIYLYHLIANDFVETKKMILLK